MELVELRPLSDSFREKCGSGLSPLGSKGTENAASFFSTQTRRPHHRRALL